MIDELLMSMKSLKLMVKLFILKVKSSEDESMNTSDEEFIDDEDFSEDESSDEEYVPPYKRQNLI